METVVCSACGMSAVRAPLTVSLLSGVLSGPLSGAMSRVLFGALSGVPTVIWKRTFLDISIKGLFLTLDCFTLYIKADPVLSLGELPCLEYLDLRHNPVTKETMYRVRVFIAFDERAAQVGEGGFVIGQKQDPYDWLKNRTLMTLTDWFILHVGSPRSGKG